MLPNKMIHFKNKDGKTISIREKYIVFISDHDWKKEPNDAISPYKIKSTVALNYKSIVSTMGTAAIVLDTTEIKSITEGDDIRKQLGE